MSSEAPPNFGKKWEYGEVTILVDMFRAGFEIDYIASELGRSRGAILGKLYGRDLVSYDPTIR